MANTPRVLVIDDDAVTLRLITNTLRTAGLIPVSAQSALEGIRAMKDHMPDVILMDLVMPGCNGDTAAGSIKDDPRYEKIPLILVSGMPDLPQIAVETGATDYLSKPFNPAELVRRVRAALQNSAAPAV